VQFFADGASGLRGYRLHSFAGDRNLIVNLEQRLFLGRELLQIVSPGVVAFMDVGSATNRSFLSGSQWKSDVGVGIRLGLPRTPRNLLRIDFAYPLNANLSGSRHFLVSFSSSQAF
jgi:outer membrane translocation and assembly module TamA